MPLAPLTLAGRHVTLIPLRPEHAPGLLTAASASRATYAFTLVPDHRQSMDHYIASALEEQERSEALPFAVLDAGGVLCGSTRFFNVEHWSWSGPPAEPVPAGPDAVEIGYTWYAESVQRTALNTEAKLLLCRHAFERWRVRRISWRTDERNARSRAAILRLGARFEGILRADRPGTDGGIRDTASYSMLASEWPEARGRLESRLDQGLVEPRR